MTKVRIIAAAIGVCCAGVWGIAIALLGDAIEMSFILRLLVAGVGGYLIAGGVYRILTQGDL